MDEELEKVFQALQSADRSGCRTADVLRSTFDQLYDGQRTRRYHWDQLFKTEKTHCGTLVEINLQREFEFSDGKELDYQIEGIEVDCKYSQKLGAWMIPPEARDHLCLLLSAEDTATPTWSMGLVRVSENHLNSGENRDGKKTLNQAGRNAIRWLHENALLPPNVLLQLPVETVDRIMASKSGQKRINELFRSALGRAIGRATVATVAQQDDYMKRVRANGGARTKLQPEGIIILGQYESHAEIAVALGVAVPQRGESVPVRVVPALKPGKGAAQIGGKLWRVASEADSVVSAPRLPEIKKSKPKRG